ncbi:MAG: hypothetical protein ABI877_18060 [Gemmatimonadaceae bacterium]
MLVFRAISTVVVSLAVASASLRAQVTDVRGVTPESAGPNVTTLKAAQLEFEGFRRDHLPTMSISRGGGSGSCDEQVGRFCYWYDERSAPPPREPESIRDARIRLIARLDSNAKARPGERWTSGQLVRYLVEAEQFTDAIAAAQRCKVDGWWCFALQGFALHMADRYREADSSFAIALAVMPEKERCDWRDLKLVLDDDLLKDYRDLNCTRRVAFERRVWWLARPMLSSAGNDARSEYYARLMYARFLEDAPSVHTLGFDEDEDERELSLRYGWAREFTREGGALGGKGGITGHEPTPAHPMLPMAASVRNPALSDSLGWRGKGLPGVRARYHADYARRLLALPHQSALFRRGDTAVVVLAYDVDSEAAFPAAVKAKNMTAALVLTRGEESDATIVRVDAPQTRGTIVARSAWGPMLLSAEFAAPDAHILSRARYGLRASDMIGSRVQVSDLLIFEPYTDMPDRLEDVIPHARAGVSMKPDAKIGIYWETYNTRPTGEGMQVSITVAPEETPGGENWLRKGLTALRLIREAKPVSVGMSDVSARGLGYTPRSVVVDLTSLKPGRYVLELEVTAEGTIPVRASRVIVISR